MKFEKLQLSECCFQSQSVQISNFVLSGAYELSEGQKERGTAFASERVVAPSLFGAILLGIQAAKHMGKSPLEYRSK